MIPKNQQPKESAILTEVKMEKTTARISLRITPVELAAYKQAAQADARSVNTWIRLTLKKGLEVK
jgi:hypothetical protein